MTSVPAQRVCLVEVGMRDGAQNLLPAQAKILTAARKVHYITQLEAAGVRTIEVGLFSHPQLVPSMADSDAVCAALAPNPLVRRIGVLPNARGLARALAVPLKTIAVFPAVTEGFCQANLKTSHAHAMRTALDVTVRARAAGCEVRGYLSVCWHCPFDGTVAPQTVVPLVNALFAAGCYEVALADTIGHATPDEVTTLLRVLQADGVSMKNIAVHFHDTFGRAINNVESALAAGVRTIDASVAGLGGCPFAPGRAGNVATETVLEYLHARGFETGIDADRIRTIGADLRREMFTSPPG